MIIDFDLEWAENFLISFPIRKKARIISLRDKAEKEINGQDSQTG